jgi:hypothetical protein
MVQNSGAKVELQVLLRVMMVGGMVSWVTMRKVRILRQSPCSIAGTACLLGGQEFWGRGKKEGWTEDRVFRLEERDGRLVVYTGDGESQHLAS